MFVSVVEVLSTFCLNTWMSLRQRRNVMSWFNKETQPMFLGAYRHLLYSTVCVDSWYNHWHFEIMQPNQFTIKHWRKCIKRIFYSVVNTLVSYSVIVTLRVSKWRKLLLVILIFSTTLLNFFLYNRLKEVSVDCVKTLEKERIKNNDCGVEKNYFVDTISTNNLRIWIRIIFAIFGIKNTKHLILNTQTFSSSPKPQ